MVVATLDSIYGDVAGVCGHVNAQQARLVRLTQRVLSEHMWEESGCRTAAHWLAWQTGTASSTARKILAVAERAASRPVLMAAFDAGELSLDQMALAVKAPTYTDAEMCGFARNATVTQLSMVVRRYGFEPDPGDPVPAPTERESAEEVSLWVDDDGTGGVTPVRRTGVTPPVM